MLYSDATVRAHGHHTKRLGEYNSGNALAWRLEQLQRGVCKLCRREKELQASHLMAPALHKKARGTGKRGNQDPTVVTLDGRWHSSFQPKDYVLCRECEGLFSKRGEHYTMGMVSQQDGTFPLLEMLTNAPSRIPGRAWTIYTIRETPNIDRERLAYFAMSVFWRASVHSLKMANGETTSICLGKKYDEEIRQYLLGDISIPPNTSLIVSVCTDKTSQRSFFAPSENGKTKDRTVGFGARGIMFFLRMTNSPLPFQRRLSMVNNPDSIMTTYDCRQHSMWWVG